MTKQHASKTKTKKQWINDEIKEKIKKYLEEANNNKNTTIQNLWHAAKAILKECLSHKHSLRNKKNIK